MEQYAVYLAYGYLVFIINDSIARWGGDCPCPYSYTWNRLQCGNNSAYIKRVPGAPYCYPQDVPPYVINQYRRDRDP
mgnify:CR=1 FL=1